MMATWLSVIRWYFVFQVDFKALCAERSIRGILKYACKSFLGGAVSSVLKFEVSGTPG